MRDGDLEGAATAALRPVTPPPEPALTLRGLVLETLRGWRLIAGGGLLGLLISLVTLWLVTPRFTVEMVIGPTARSGPAAMGPRVPVGPGGASRTIVEHGIGDEALSDYARYAELLCSVPVAERLARQPGILRTLFETSVAPDGGWRPPGDPFSRAKRLLLRLAGRDSWLPPDAHQLARLLEEELIVTPVGDGPMRRLRFRHPDREFGRTLLAAIHAAAEGLIREEAERRTGAEIDYLRRRVQEETSAENRRAFGGLLAEQERIRQMIAVALPFAADVIEPPSAPGLPDWPDPLVLLAVGALAGGAIGMVIVYARGAWRQAGP